MVSVMKYLVVAHCASGNKECFQNTVNILCFKLCAYFQVSFLSHVDLMEFSFYMLILGFQGSDWGISE